MVIVSSYQHSCVMFYDYILIITAIEFLSTKLHCGKSYVICFIVCAMLCTRNNLQVPSILLDIEFDIFTLQLAEGAHGADALCRQRDLSVSGE